MKRAFALALVVALVSCGDDLRPSVTGNDGGGGSDAPPDTPPAATFTTFVLDLVKNQTADNTQPKPFADFSTLPDPDGDNNNLDAYKSLFQ